MMRIRSRVEQLTRIATLQTALVARDSLVLAERRKDEARAARQAELLRSQATQAEAVWAECMDPHRLHPALMAHAALDWIGADAAAIEAEKGHSQATISVESAESALRTSVRVREACAASLHKGHRALARKREEAFELNRDDVLALRRANTGVVP